MRQRRLTDRLVAATDLPSEPFPRQTLVELLGEDRVLVENHRGIAQYGKETISVKTKYGEVGVNGSNLELICMSCCQLVIRGRIDSVVLHRKG